MKLLGPAFFRVEVAEKNHEETGKLLGIAGSYRFTTANFVEGLSSFPLGTYFGVAVSQAVVGETASAVVKVLVPLAQGTEKIGEPRHLNVRRLAQLIGPFIERCRIIDLHGAVRTKRRKHSGRA